MFYKIHDYIEFLFDDQPTIPAAGEPTLSIARARPGRDELLNQVSLPSA